ncbi:MAG: ATP-binding protein [Candidatus Bathyarchaeia archaeon]
MNNVKHEILNSIFSVFNKKAQELGYKSNCRFLLLGPPGTGKTLIALVAAAENNVNFLKIRGSEFISGANFIGEPEKKS